MTSDVCVALITAPATVAASLARTLVAERFAACVNLLPGVTSVYRWEGELQEDVETLLIVKTTRARFDALCEKVLELHPYDVLECIAVPVTVGLPAYLNWVNQECEVPD
jgi:periplasmic divalent cation tolerance protein